MPDTFAIDWPTALAEHERELAADCVPLTDPRAAIAAIESACANLVRALDANGHVAAGLGVELAARDLEAAASHSPEHRDVLLILAGRAIEACQEIGWPDVAEIQRVEDEAAALLAPLRETGDG